MALDFELLMLITCPMPNREQETLFACYALLCHFVVYTIRELFVSDDGVFSDYPSGPLLAWSSPWSKSWPRLTKRAVLAVGIGGCGS